MTKWPNGNRWKRRWRLQSSKCREGVLKMRCCNKMQAMEAKKKVSKRTMVGIDQNMNKLLTANPKEEGSVTNRRRL
jgi:hypothetical protein